VIEGTEGMLEDGWALYVAMQADGEEAAAMRWEMIEVLMAWKHRMVLPKRLTPLLQQLFRECDDRFLNRGRPDAA
jgi:hypothetical protein